MGKVIVLPETTKNPITLIGQRAGVCWGADVSDDKKNYNRGLDCIESGHGRTLEFVNVELVLDGYSARVIREYYTHIGGAPTRLQASTRYIDYNGFDYIVPESVLKNDSALFLYHEIMDEISKSAQKLEQLGIPREDSALILPLGMKTKIVDKRNLRNLIDMSRNRMCNRAYWEFRQLFQEILWSLNNYSDEWFYIVQNYMKPKCEVLGYCPETRSCGKVVQKKHA